MNELKLEIKNISKGFGEIYNREDILEDFDLKVMSTELLVLVGPSGCGKSTFVNLIAGFDKVDSGSIIMDGKEINKPRFNTTTLALRRNAPHSVAVRPVHLCRLCT